MWWLPVGSANVPYGPGQDPWTTGGNVSRRCKNPECSYEVPFSYKESGYCTKKYGAHWNEAEPGWDRPKCECGADSTKSYQNPHPKHSHWCPVDKWENNASMYSYRDTKD